MDHSFYKGPTCCIQEQENHIDFYLTSQNTLGRSFKADESVWTQLSFLPLVTLVEKKRKELMDLSETFAVHLQVWFVPSLEGEVPQNKKVPLLIPSHFGG